VVLLESGDHHINQVSRHSRRLKGNRADYISGGGDRLKLSIGRRRQSVALVEDGPGLTAGDPARHRDEASVSGSASAILKDADRVGARVTRKHDVTVTVERYNEPDIGGG